MDLYLLHWRGGVPLSETIEGMERLVEEGRIIRWGVSNFDTEDMRQLTNQFRGTHCVTNQVLYHLGSRGIEYDLLPWQREHGMPIMAYCPLAQAGNLRRGILDHKVVKDIASQHKITPLQLLLGWTIRHEDVLAIPKASKIAHVEENAAAAGVRLSVQDLSRLDDILPAPTRKLSLDMV